MDRVVYCPDEQSLPEAEHLAKEWNVSVQLGDSPRTLNLDFDRDNVCLIGIPIEQWFSVKPKKPGRNRKITAHYVDEFHPTKDVYLECEHENGQIFTFPYEVLSGKHRSVFCIQLQVPGKYKLKACDQDGVIAVEEIEVI